MQRFHTPLWPPRDSLQRFRGSSRSVRILPGPSLTAPPNISSQVPPGFSPGFSPGSPGRSPVLGQGLNLFLVELFLLAFLFNEAPELHLFPGGRPGIRTDSPPDTA